MNLPVVGFRIDGLSEIVRHELTGFLTTPRDLAQMAVYCGYLLENANRRQEMGKEGNAWVTEDFNLPGMIRKIESLYTELPRKENLMPDTTACAGATTARCAARIPSCHNSPPTLGIEKR